MEYSNPYTFVVLYWQAPESIQEVSVYILSNENPSQFHILYHLKGFKNICRVAFNLIHC